MANSTYQVAVILINYNSSQFTLDCVNSIRAKTAAGLRFQIIVIDNNSRPEEYQKLAKLDAQEDVRIFRSRINTGFSGANMLGVQWADADYYYFLNNDCILLNDCLGILHAFLEQHREVANGSGEMFVASGEYEVNFGYFPTLSMKLLGSGLMKLLYPGKFPDKHVRMTKPTRVDLVNGSSMFMRAAAFDGIGGFDTNYFLYCEEEDIALRLSRKGFATYLVPEAKYQHFVSRSTDKDGSINLVYLKEFYISFFYYYRKNYHAVYAGAIRFLYFFKMISKFYKQADYVKLAFFIAGGAPVKHSLRFKQMVN